MDIAGSLKWKDRILCELSIRSDPELGKCQYLVMRSSENTQVHRFLRSIAANDYVWITSSDVSSIRESALNSTKVSTMVIVVENPVGPSNEVLSMVNQLIHGVVYNESNQQQVITPMNVVIIADNFPPTGPWRSKLGMELLFTDLECDRQYYMHR